MKNFKSLVVEMLKSYSEKDIILSAHAEIRLFQRQINKEEVINNILNPKRLEYALKEDAKNAFEEKFDCYFQYSKTQCHRYVLLFTEKVVVVTVVKINRRWQKIVEAKLRGARLK